MQPTVEVLRDKLESLNPLSERMPCSDRLSYLLNALEPLSPSERISFVLQELPGKAMATTSGGIQSALLPSFFQKVRETQPETAAKIDSLPIVLIDTGDLFQESIDYVSRMKRDLGLNFLRIKHDLGKGEFKLLHSALTDRGMSPAEAFDRITKVEPLRTFRNEHGIQIWFAGNRRDQSRSRASLPLIEVENGVWKVYPLADVTKGELPQLADELGVEPHPLSDRYASIGNRSETRRWDPNEMTFEKDGRHGGVRTECGLHNRWGAELIERGVPIREEELD